MLVTRLIIDALLVLLLLNTGGGKLRQTKSSLAIRDSLNLGAQLWRAIGILELLAALGLLIGIWIPTAGLIASAGIGVLMVGAIVARAHAGQRQPAGYVVDATVLLIAVASVVLSALTL